MILTLCFIVQFQNILIEIDLFLFYECEKAVLVILDTACPYNFSPYNEVQIAFVKALKF